MKKFVSLIALAGALVACHPENIETAFVVDDAQVTIKVTCIDVASGTTVTPTLSTDKGVVNGQTVVITGNPSIPETTVTVTAPYQGATPKESIKINAVKAGGVASYNLLIVVGTKIGDWTLSAAKSGAPVVVTTSSTFKPKHAVSHNYSHNGVDYTTWAENDSEWILEGQFTYNQYTGYEASQKDIKILDATFGDSAKLLIESVLKNENINGIKAVPSKYDFKVSAWSLYLGYATLTTTSQKYEVIATNAEKFTKPVAEFVVKTKNVSDVNVLEIAHPSHGHSYIHGHGHTDAHGSGTTSANAGGGIIFAE